MNIVEKTFKKRSNPAMAAKCAEISELHLKEFPFLSEHLRRFIGGRLPQVPTFQYYATLLFEHGDFEKAIEVCQIAISYGLEDGTSSGFQGRIDRIKKQQLKSKPKQN